MLTQIPKVKIRVPKASKKARENKVLLKMVGTFDILFLIYSFSAYFISSISTLIFNYINIM